MTAVELRLPELSGGTTQEQLRRMQSYLYTLAQQLQIAFDTVTQQSDSSKQQADSPSSGQENPAVDFAAVKALILKSAEITQHFQQQVEKSLSGSYVAQSQFGVFRQETEQRITANAQSIQQKFSNIQQLEAAVAELKSSMVEVNATIRTGLLTQGPDGADTGGRQHLRRGDRPAGMGGRGDSLPQIHPAHCLQAVLFRQQRCGGGLHQRPAAVRHRRHGVIHSDGPRPGRMAPAG